MLPPLVKMKGMSMSQRWLPITLAVLATMSLSPRIYAAVTTTPLVLYTDLASGPNSGGENGKGVYLSVFGKNFGAGAPGTAKVTIGGVEVDNYRYVGPAKGRADIQQITVQIGAIGNPTPGAAKAVQVVVNGVGSNTDRTFTVNPGRMLFVDNVQGNDGTAVPGDIAHPYKHVQGTSLATAAYGAMVPGDIIVMRGTGTAWTELGYDTYFVKFAGKNASAPTGAASTGPFTLMGYPNEDVFIDIVGNVGKKGAISGVDTTSYDGGRWITIADLRIESGGNAGVIAQQIAGDHWRIVNNDLSAASATNTAKAAGINGNGPSAFWVGNHIHNIAGGVAQENHGIYIDGDGTYEIAYNTIDHVSGGSGMQVYVNGGNGSDYADNVHFHHNVVHDISKHGINIADNMRNGLAIWNNVVYNTAIASLRFNTNTLHGAKIYNNTFYNAITTASDYDGAITNDWNFPSDALDMRNNLIMPAPNMPYTGGSVGFCEGVGCASVGTIAKNLWTAGGTTFGFDSNPVTGNALFVDATNADFHLKPGSAAIDSGLAAVSALVTDDFDVVVSRPPATAFDIGAYEYQAGYVYDRIFIDGFQ